LLVGVRIAGVIALAAAMLLATGGGALAQPDATAIACSAIPGYPVEGHPPVREGNGLLVLPLVLHVMEANVPSDDPRGLSSARSVWTPDKVDQHFAPERGLVNRIWNTAGIRVAVMRVDACPYAPAYLRPDKKATVIVPVPGEGPEWDRYYHEVNERYNARDVKALNVYLWVKTGTGGSSIYYGSSTRQETAAVWIDMMCVFPENPATPGIDHVMLPPTCARLIAHEIGHALTMPHTCKDGSPPPGHKDFDLTPCSRQNADPTVSLEIKQNLMRPDHDFEHTLLTRDQKADTQNAVAAYR
jgi:hypothetical protein